MRVEARRAFTGAYRKARLWLDRLETEPALSVTAIAHSGRRTERSVRQTLSLAFLDPALVEAAMEGRLPPRRRPQAADRLAAALAEAMDGAGARRARSELTNLWPLSTVPA
jgi:hypothetical protein